jgi:restriction endonuclease
LATEYHAKLFAHELTRGNTADDDDTYSLIMRDKERLLDPDVPLRFIFSHSALREGWDNPNVFQICTLNETQSVERKRQEIGRGLRLPVNAAGERVHDETVNRLTVIANESYEDFARTLQTEFEEDFGIKFGRVEKIAFAKLVRTDTDGTETALGQDASVKLWGELVAKGYLSASGDILEKFDPKNPHFKLEVSEEFAALAPEIIDEVNRKLFKLPSWFKIDTPIGTYNPDWAFVTERDEKLYFVRETKSTLDSEERRTKENQKIACGRRHFDSIGVDFAVVTSLAEVTM